MKVLTNTLAVLAIVALTATVTATATAAPTPRATPLVEQASLRPQGGVWSLLLKLLAKVRYRGQAVVTNTAKDYAKSQAADWTRQQAINWWCNRWYQWFGRDADRWARATWYDANARYAWHFCEATG